MIWTKISELREINFSEYKTEIIDRAEHNCSKICNKVHKIKKNSL